MMLYRLHRSPALSLFIWGLCGLFAGSLAACSNPEGDPGNPDPQGGQDGPEAPDGGGSPSCAKTLAGRMTSFAIPLAQKPTASPFATPLSKDGVLVAFVLADGVHLSARNKAGTALYPDMVLPNSVGSTIYGLAAQKDDAWGVLISRKTDVLSLVLLGPKGITKDQTVIGDVSHTVTNNEWFGTGIRAGRLRYVGDRYAAYYTVQRLWNDGIAHYGDQLRFYGADGARINGGWDWGCSHSMEVNLAHNGTLLGPVCSSDCYPKKGVFFNKETLLHSDDAASNCAGKYGTHVGGVVPHPSGFWVAYTARDKRMSADLALAKVGNDRKLATTVWLTEGAGDDDQPRITRVGMDGLLIGHRAGDGKERLLLSSFETGMQRMPPETMTLGLSSTSDFFTYSPENGAIGDAGWVSSSATGLQVYRLATCQN